MKLTIILLTVSLFQVQASTKFEISLDFDNASLEQIFNKIEEVSEFRFLYETGSIDLERKLSLNVNTEKISDILALLFRGTAVNYKIHGRQIILTQQDLGTSSPKTDTLDTGPNRKTTIQQQEITGTVTDANGTPLPGANILEKGTKNGVTTDFDGNFSLQVSDVNTILVISYIGFETREVELNGQKNINITLTESAAALDEVVVVGYGTQKRASITGAVDVVGKEATEGRAVPNVTEALQGQSPNLIIQQTNFQPGTGGHLNINIRGLGSTNNNDPLIVIDGIIGGDLNLLNPNDIQSVSILKDAGAAAIYGSRAANGVILVTTKKGRRNETPVVTYSGNFGLQTPRITFHKVHAWQNAMYKNISLANSGRPQAFTDAQIEQLKEQGDSDWTLDNILRDAPKQTHNISVSGGGANNTYLLSFGYFDQENMLVGPDKGRSYGSRRYNFRYSQTTNIGKFDLTTIFSYVKAQYKEPPTDTKQNIISDVTRAALYNDFQDDQGNWLSNDVSGSNPKAILEEGGSNNTNNDQVTGNFRGEYNITPALKLTGVFGGTVRANTRFQRQINLQFPAGSFASNRQVLDDNTKSLFTNTQLLAEYKKTFNEKHDLNILLGVTNESYKEEGNGVRKSNTDATLGIPTTGTTIDAGTTDASYNSITDTRETSLNSALGRIQYSYNNKYFLDVNFRYDGSSNFPKDKRWGFFPSVGLKWRATDENFLNNYKEKIGDLNIRATYGLLGNQSVNPYQYISTYSTNNNVYGFDNSVVSGATRNLANPDLTWETAATFDVGLDGSLLQNKLTFSFDYFEKISDDILQERQDVPVLFGSGLPTYNISKVKSWGWEASVAFRSTGKLFTQNFSFNIADNQNKLLDLGYGVNEYIFKREEFWYLRKVGLPITVYEGYKTNGLYQTTEELAEYPKFGNTSPGLGDEKFVDQNGDGVINEEDRVVLGNPFPRFTYGFTYDVTYKGFDARVFVQGVGKRDQLIRGELLEAYHYGYSGTLYEHQQDFWTPENTDAKFPRIAENGSDSNSINYKVGSDIYLFNAAYARLKNIQIGYSLPTESISKLHLQKVRIYLTGENVITISKLKIIDPEQSEFNNRADIRSNANSARAYPTPIFYGLGLEITF